MRGTSHRWYTMVALWGLVVSVGCQQSDAEPEAQDAVTITVGTVAPRDMHQTVQADGVLESLHTPQVAAEASGLVERVCVEVGDAVAAGQVMVVLDATSAQLDVAAAQQELKRVQALLAHQTITVRRHKRLVQHNAQSQDQLDQRVAEERALQAQAEAAAVHLQQMQRVLSKTKVRAPVSGRVQSRAVSEGDWVAQGTSLVQLVQMQPLRARLSVPDTEAAALQPGQSVQLQLGQTTAAGRVSRIAPMLGEHNRMLRVWVDWDDAAGGIPGSIVRGVITVAVQSQVLAVPESAVVPRIQGPVVYVIDDDHQAHAHNVAIGLREAGWVALTGVQAGDTVAQDGAAFLTDGAHVRVVQAD